ncbi:MAG: ATP-binding protein [Microbacterium sp.]|nr:ATP-binding protein [Microbacterium sp.]
MSHRTRPTANGEGLVVPSNFIRAARESGYVSLATALAELIDNSIQAGATEIDLTVARADGASYPEIEVLDNGVGMNRNELELCLKFGGSSRFDRRESFGRFGMGLPAASLSQARQIEITAWQNSGPAFAVTLDVDAIVAGEPPALRAKSSGPAQTPSGCRVTWRTCDRIEYQRLGWLERSLRRDLGRMYRRFLSEGLRISLNARSLEPEDPMMMATSIEGAVATPAFTPLAYELRTADGGSGWVHVRFAILPVQHWHDLDKMTKRRLGIVGGGGVSVLRAGREIAHGWHLMGAKRRENYDDWWRCEIEFDPSLDEHFGITINKQGIRPSNDLREALEPELESIARMLNARVRQSFEEVKFQAAAAISCRVAEAADPDLPVMKDDCGHGSGPLAYRITTAQLTPELIFATSLRANTLEVRLNVDHPAYTALYGPLQALTDDAGTQLRTAVELLLLSIARASVVGGDDNDQLLVQWGSTFGRMLQRT